MMSRDRMVERERERKLWKVHGKNADSEQMATTASLPTLWRKQNHRVTYAYSTQPYCIYTSWKQQKKQFLLNDIQSMEEAFYGLYHMPCRLSVRVREKNMEKKKTKEKKKKRKTRYGEWRMKYIKWNQRIIVYECVWKNDDSEWQKYDDDDRKRNGAV